MKKREAWTKTWAEELVEQAEQRKRIYKSLFFLSMALNGILAAVIFFR